MKCKGLGFHDVQILTSSHIRLKNTCHSLGFIFREIFMKTYKYSWKLGNYPEKWGSYYQALLLWLIWHSQEILLLFVLKVKKQISTFIQSFSFLRYFENNIISLQGVTTIKDLQWRPWGYFSILYSVKTISKNV